MSFLLIVVTSCCYIHCCHGHSKQSFMVNKARHTEVALKETISKKSYETRIKARKNNNYERLSSFLNLGKRETRNMEARREFLQMPKVQLKQKFWVTEDSIAKLLMVGAKIVETVTQTDHYYDTASDDLAMAGLWLSRRDQEWFLIVESQKEGSQEKLEEQSQGDASNPVPEPREPLCQKMTNVVQRDTSDVCRKLSKSDPKELESLPSHQDQQLDGKTADSESEGPNSSSAFTELVGKSEIMAYLEAHLRLDLQTEERENATMEFFLQKAGVEHYASNRLINQATYLLSDRYTIIVQREESCLRASVTVLLEVDVFNICRGWEEIEKLAAYLGFQRQGSQSEREFMT